MRGTRIYDLKRTNKQKQTIDDLEETIRVLKQQNLETRTSLFNEFVKISNIGHSNDINKNIKITDIADKVTKELWEDLKNEIFVENDEEGKIIELDASGKHI